MGLMVEGSSRLHMPAQRTAQGRAWSAPQQAGRASREGANPPVQDGQELHGHHHSVVPLEYKKYMNESVPTCAVGSLPQHHVRTAPQAGSMHAPAAVATAAGGQVGEALQHEQGGLHTQALIDCLGGLQDGHRSALHREWEVEGSSD